MTKEELENKLLYLEQMRINFKSQIGRLEAAIGDINITMDNLRKNFCNDRHDMYLSYSDYYTRIYTCKKCGYEE